jgi:hypothetical protein
MLTVAPILAVATLMCADPARWDASLNPVTLIIMALFGIVTVPLWLTLIPALIITPLVMRLLAGKDHFKKLRLSTLIILSLVLGAMGGILVLSPMVLLSLGKQKVVLSWVAAGAVAGSITSSLIILLYRRDSLAPPKASEGSGLESDRRLGQ